MSKELLLFQKDILSLKQKFYILMDLLITNQPSSRIECIIFIGISYIQMISGFFAKQVKVFNNESTSDQILLYLEKIFRFLDLLNDKYSEFKIIIIFILIIIIIFIVYFFIICSKIHKHSFYSLNEKIINYFIKCLIYIGYNIILDLVFSNFCFGENETNPFYKNVSCKIKDNIPIVIISIILLIITFFLTFFIQCFYCDSFYISISFYSRISCNYEIYLTFNSLFYSIFLIECKYLSKEIFLLYNLIISTFFIIFYFKHYLFYDIITNTIVGLFHILYLWTSIFCFIFAYINFYEKGVIYIISSIIISYFYFILKIRIEEKIFLDTPFFKITNKSHFLYYLKNIMDKINLINENSEEKAILAGIMHMHAIECPNVNCLSKTKNKLYLPMTNEWSDRTKPNIDDKVFLLNFITIVMNYFIDQNYYSPDMVINLSFYYLEIIGNFCLSMFYYKKVKEMKLTLQEQFSLERLKIKISKSLIEKLKSPNEECSSIEDIDVTIYFKYSDLSDKFIEEINNDINLSLEFWKIFEQSQLNNRKQIDYNKIFFLTNRIRITKEKIEKLWNKLIEIYNGVNDLFLLYSDYVEQINDDDLKKRELEGLKRKNENFSEQISQNYYSILFNKDTGIIIANGDKGKEGLIEKTNLQIEKIFKYKCEELKGVNINILMPKIYSQVHNDFIKRFYDIGEKLIIDKKILKTFGKDKDNAIIMLKIILKTFPILNENVYFIGIISKENIDDIIFIDSKFNIQGTSSKIMNILNFDNNLLFQENEIPFYVICKQFVNFYKIFLQGKKQNEKENSVKKLNSLLIDSSSNLNNGTSEDNNYKEEHKEKELQENIEINENIELEYEIIVPNFLYNYCYYSFQNGINDKNKLLSPKDKTNIEEKNKEISNDFSESDLLINDSEKSSSNTSYINNKNNKEINYKEQNLTPKIEVTPSPNETPTPNPNNYNILLSNNNENNNNKYKNQNKKNKLFPSTIQNSKIEIMRLNEEKKFHGKMEKYKDLFESKQFDELESYINSNINTSSKSYKFNFTFDRITFGKNNLAYMIRCIDNKNEISSNDDESMENMNPLLVEYKKEKADAIKPIFEILKDEKKNLISQEENFYILSIKNHLFQKLLNSNKENIKKFSIIHGKKKDAFNDENGSQTSQSGYKSNLLKKNKIEEIKSNLLKNSSKFYALNYIKYTVIFIGLSSIIYSIIYYLLFKNVYKNLKIVNRLNIDLFQSTILYTNLVGTLISLSTIFAKNQLNLEYYYNSFIEDNIEYFNFLKRLSYLWYNNITEAFGEIEFEIGFFLNEKNSVQYFWDLENMTFILNHLNESETFPFIFSHALSDINNILLQEKFSINKNQSFIFSELEDYFYQYFFYLSIDSSILNIIPNLYRKIKIIPKLFQEKNKSSINQIFFFLYCYIAINVILSIIYWVYIFIVNQNMEDGLEKIGKIQLEKIEETIKKIETFFSILKQHFDNKIILRENQNTINNNEVNLSQIQKTNNEILNDNEESQKDLDEFETNKVIKLKLLTTSYFHSISLFITLIIFLITIYYFTKLTITSSNKLIDIEYYIFSKIIIAGASLLDVKIMISQSYIDVYFNRNYSTLIDGIDIQKITQAISLFDKLKIFYNEKFLLNACKTIFLENTTEYQKCINDDLIKSANSSDSLLRLMTQISDEIFEFDLIYNGNNFTLKNGNVVEYQSFYLLELSAYALLENMFYVYIIPISPIFSSLCIESLSDYLFQNRTYIYLIIICFNIVVISLCLHNIICYRKKIIYYLIISRCILKIIPTSIISSTPELELWIEENKN